MLEKVRTLKRHQIIMIAAILATIPCYCFGMFLLWNANRLDSAGELTATLTETALFDGTPPATFTMTVPTKSATLTPTITATFTVTTTYSVPETPTATASLIPTETDIPTETPIPTATATTAPSATATTPAPTETSESVPTDESSQQGSTP